MAFNGFYESVVSWGGSEPESHDIVEGAIRKEQVLKCVGALLQHSGVTD